MLRPTFLAAAGGLALALSSLAVAQPPPDFPLRCSGRADMASTSWNNVIVEFVPANGQASEGLQPGQCSWLDRALRNGEPTRVVAETRAVGTAQSIAAAMNRGETWTFWVFNAGRFFHATANARGAATRKPVPFDE